MPTASVGFLLTANIEEMDVIFGSEGVAAADYERQNEINHEIGLDAALARIVPDNLERVTFQHEHKVG